MVKGESSKKATNKDLPLGAQPAFCHDVVPTIWHWVAGNVRDPFNIDEYDLVKTLGVIWRHTSGDMYMPTKCPLKSLQLLAW